MTALTLVLALLEAGPHFGDAAGIWEIAKGVIQSLCLLGIAAVLWRLRRVTYLDTVVNGVDGTNGLRGDVKTLKSDVVDIKKRNNRIDDIAEYEKQHYQGEERRMGSRRLRDVARDVEEETGQ